MASVSTSWSRLQADPKVCCLCVHWETALRGALHFAVTHGSASAQAWGSLHTLATNKHLTASFSTDQVAILLRILQQLWHEQTLPAAQRATAFSQIYQLLARWAHVQHSTARTPTARSQLQDAVAGALQLLQSLWCTAEVSAACILFLGTASQGKSTHRLICKGKHQQLDLDSSFYWHLFEMVGTRRP